MIIAELPEIRTLDERDIHAILARNIVGRIAFLRRGEIEIRPVSYVYSDDFIYLRSSSTSSLADTDPSGRAVGFEVDEIHSTTRWSTVVVRGTLFRIEREKEHEEWMRALGKLRRLMPEALRSQDPAAHRTEVFRILIRSATGRSMG